MKKTMEEWRPIENYEGLYEVSNYGNIRSLERAVTYTNGAIHIHKGKLLNQKHLTGGYLYVWLSKNGKVRNYRVHRLVAKAFLDNKSNLPQVNHKDKCRTNNYVENLEWCTASDNQKHAYSLGRNYYILPTRHTSIEVLKDGFVVDKFFMIKDCCLKYGIKSSSITRILKGQRKSAKGYTFRKYEINDRRIS